MNFFRYGKDTYLDDGFLSGSTCAFDIISSNAEGATVVATVVALASSLVPHLHVKCKNLMLNVLMAAMTVIVDMSGTSIHGPCSEIAQRTVVVISIGSCTCLIISRNVSAPLTDINILCLHLFRLQISAIMQTSAMSLDGTRDEQRGYVRPRHACMRVLVWCMSLLWSYAQSSV